MGGGCIGNCSMTVAETLDAMKEAEVWNWILGGDLHEDFMVDVVKDLMVYVWAKCDMKKEVALERLEEVKYSIVEA